MVLRSKDCHNEVIITSLQEVIMTLNRHGNRSLIRKRAHARVNEHQFGLGYEHEIRTCVFKLFSIFAQNIDCGYTQCDLNEYSQSMVCIKNTKNVYPLTPPIYYMKGREGR